MYVSGLHAVKFCIADSVWGIYCLSLTYQLLGQDEREKREKGERGVVVIYTLSFIQVSFYVSFCWVQGMGRVES